MAKAKEKTVIDTSSYDYDKIRIRDKEGKIRHSTGNGDAVALAMLGMTHDDLVSVMTANKLDEKLGKYVKSLNPGHFRMLLGQTLRGMVKRGEPVKIGKHRVEKLTQKVDVSSVIATAAPKSPKKAAKKAA